MAFRERASSVPPIPAPEMRIGLVDIVRCCFAFV